MGRRGNNNNNNHRGGGKKKKQQERELPQSPFLCAAVAKGHACPRLKDNTHCKFSHDLSKYLAENEEDLQLPSFASLEGYAAGSSSSSSSSSSADLQLTPTTCPTFDHFGICLSGGYKCRFLHHHLVQVADREQSFQECGFDLAFDEAKMRQRAQECKSRVEGPQLSDSMTVDELKTFFYERKGELNFVRGEDQKKYRGRKDAVFPRSKAFFEALGENWKSDKDWSSNAPQGRRGPGKKSQSQPDPEQEDTENKVDTKPEPEEGGHQEGKAAHEAVEQMYLGHDPTTQDEKLLAECHAKELHGQDEDEDGDGDAHMRQSHKPDREPVKPRERRSLDFRDKLYLAPLTTIGNLPFRKLCVNYGADITCGEMGLATEFLGGNPSEWALTRRDPTEKCFGVQLAGARTQQITPAAEAIADACPDLDFIDINVGCPIDLVVKKGAGSSLLEHPGKLGKSCLGLSHVVDLPFTIKLRTGFTDAKLVASNFFRRAASEWGCSAATLHGRTRAQRYSKDADYAYIQQAVQELREFEALHDLPRMPLVGNGDAYDPVVYYENIENSGVDTIMVARGALMKPWIFTELKERRRWDISASERLQGIQKLCRDGMMHWGTDEQGLTTTRKFVLESLSFQYRYVPVGVLETLPSTLSNQPKDWTARSDLEGLLSSPMATDWRKIASFFLGPEPEGFHFAVRPEVLYIVLAARSSDAQGAFPAQAQVEH